MIVVGLALAFIPRDYENAVHFYKCMEQEPPFGEFPLEDQYDYCMNRVAHADYLSVYLMVGIPAAGIIFLILAIVFLVISVFCCGAIGCVKYSSRVFTTIFFALFADTVFFWGSYFFLGDNFSESQPSTREVLYATFLGTNSVGQYISLAAAWLLTAILAPFLTAGNKCFMKTIVILLGAVVAAGMMELLLWADYYKVVVPIPGEASESDYYLVGLGLSLSDAVIYVVQACFCFCGAHLRGCCCCKKGEDDGGRLLDDAD